MNKPNYDPFDSDMGISETEPNAFSEALMDNPTKAHEMSPGELLFKQLNNDWLDQVPTDLKQDEELRLKWLYKNTFEKYLIALIILDILVLNDRKLINTGKKEDATTQPAEEDATTK